jgi:DNA-binding FadR family transcriptional regulator
MVKASSQVKASKLSLSYTIYEKMIALIIGGHFPARTRLPPELELSARFDVSRPILRMALARLREDGLIASRQGSGSYVLRQPDQAVLNFAPISSIADIQNCFKFRIGIEGESAYLAAVNHDEASLASIQKSLSALDRAEMTDALGVTADYDFHLAIAEASGNRFITSTMVSIKEHIAFGMNLTRNLSLMRPPDRLAMVQDEHHAIFNAIERREPEQARSRMRAHLENARRRVFEGEIVRPPRKPI